MKLSIIIINHSGLINTINCIESIQAHLKGDYEIICIDNSNDDVDYLKLKRIFQNSSNFRFYKIKNKGFGNACNIGSQRAKGEFLFFLNNDAVIINSKVPSDMNLEKGTIYCPTVYNPDLSYQTSFYPYFNLIQLIFFSFQLRSRLRKKLEFFAKYHSVYPKRKSQEVLTKDKHWGSGCALIIQKKWFQNLNGFDERFFMYLEDQDICIRNLKLGGDIKQMDCISLIHKIGGAESKSKVKINHIKSISSIQFAKIHMKHFNFIIIWILHKIFNKKIFRQMQSPITKTRLIL
jgi:GT2 family glycosyltransferase